MVIYSKCTKCLEIKPLDNFSRDKSKPGNNYHSYVCKPCVKAYMVIYNKVNKEKISNQHKKYWEANKERLYTPGRLEKVKKYQRDNPAKSAALARRYQARRMNACPKWLTVEQKQEILNFYKRARVLGLVVDHIVPLKGKLVSGLHVPWNLQLLTLSENSSKNNRFDDWTVIHEPSLGDTSMPVPSSS